MVATECTEQTEHRGVSPRAATGPFGTSPTEPCAGTDHPALPARPQDALSYVGPQTDLNMALGVAIALVVLWIIVRVFFRVTKLVIHLALIVAAIALAIHFLNRA